MDLATWAARGAANQRKRDRWKRPRPSPNLQFRADDQAIKAWRQGEAPAQSIQIPEDLVFQDEKFYNVISRQYGTFIFSQGTRGNAGVISFGIWGESTATKRTQQDIEAVVDELQQPKKSRRSAAFAKLVSLNDTQHKRAEKSWQREVKRQKFRMYPSPSSKFGAIGTFHWPVQEYRPDKLLGSNYEALDPIRMDCSCYVVFVSEKSAFQIMGKAEDVQKGLLRIRKTCFQIAARQIAPVRRYLLHQVEDAQIPKEVVLSQYERPLVVSGEQKMKAVPGSSLRGHGHGTRKATETISNELRVRALMLTTLPKLHYYRASLYLRIRLGTFLATTFRRARAQDSIYTLDEYEEMTQESQFVGEVTAELGNKEVERNALSILQQADDLLVPQHALTYDLIDVRPVYSVLFTFADEAGNLCLTMVWEEVQDEGASTAAFEVISKKWSRLERDIATTATIVDVSLKDVTSGFSWHFDLHAAQFVEESGLSAQLVNFAHGVRINAYAARKNPFEQGFVTFKPYAGHIKSIQQSMRYRFGIRCSEYTVELSRFQERRFPPGRSLLLPSEKALVVYEPRWCLEVYSTEWDRMFTRNERLPIGERADWEDGVDAWFPKDIGGDDDAKGRRDGFVQMMEKLNKLSKLMKESKDEDLIEGFTGMTVG